MTEAILFAVIVVLCLLIGFIEWQNRRERNKLVNALISKSTSEFAALETVDKTPPAPPIPVPDLIPTSDMTDAEFEKFA